MRVKRAGKLLIISLSIIGLLISIIGLLLTTVDLPLSAFYNKNTSSDTSHDLATGSVQTTQTGQTTPITSTPPTTISIGLPLRLEIPKLKVSTSLEHLGLTSKGAMAVPKGGDNAAWYKLGVRPGEVGSAVIAGHYGTWKNGKGSIFDQLHTLVSGDMVYVEDDQGNTISFVVRAIKIYDPQDDASAVFASNDGKSHLNIITCAGAWDKVRKTYPKRLVLFTDRVE